MVRRVIAKIGKANIRLIITSGLPINKPKSLNAGLASAKGEIIVPFDAEDSPHPEIYNLVNTAMARKSADVVQAGVQLMNLESNWYSAYNVLEYFFWFKSILPYFSRHGVVPLAGNTVFFKRSWLNQVGNWDEQCLTEDADIGIKLSQAGANIEIVYREDYVTREETPPTLAAFIKQRTRWHQGFMQILGKGEWRKFLSFKQQLLSLYILAWPEIQALLSLYTFASIATAFVYNFPVWVTIVSLMPLYVMAVLFFVYLAGLYEFCKSYNKSLPWFMPLKMLLAFYPFQIVLGFSAMRAVTRLLFGYQTWEKTKHVGAHRPELTSTLNSPIE